MINIITLIWIFFAIVLFCFPTATPVTASSMNYASLLFVFFSGCAFAWYLIWGRRNYDGPAILRAEGGVSTIREVDTIEAQLKHSATGSDDTNGLKHRDQTGVQSAGMI